jgi:hypothetical protein
MTTQAATVGSGRTRTLNLARLASLAVWLGACWTTWQGLLGIGVPAGFEGWVAAMIVQIAFTAVERNIWRGRYNVLAVLVLGIDALINAGGLWRWLARVDQTPAWLMLRDALGAPETLDSVSKVLIALVVGVVLAYLPEAIWEA